MNLYEILLSLEGKSEKEAKVCLRRLGVKRSDWRDILGCYSKKKRKLKAKHVGL